MRSEERSGVVFLIMLFIWGTLPAEPLHIFVSYIKELVLFILAKFSVAGDTGIADTVLIIVLELITVLLMKISGTFLWKFIPLAVTVAALGVFLVRAATDNVYDLRSGIALCSLAFVTGIIYLTRRKSINLWYSDLFVFMLPVYLLTGLVFESLASINGVTSKIFYIASHHDGSLVSHYDKTLGIPGIVWGVFIAVLCALPVIYYSFGRKDIRNE